MFSYGLQTPFQGHRLVYHKYLVPRCDVLPESNVSELGYAEITQSRIHGGVPKVSLLANQSEFPLQRPLSPESRGGKMFPSYPGLQWAFCWTSALGIEFPLLGPCRNTDFLSQPVYHLGTTQSRIQGAKMFPSYSDATHSSGPNWCIVAFAIPLDNCTRNPTKGSRTGQRLLR